MKPSEGNAPRRQGSPWIGANVIGAGVGQIDRVDRSIVTPVGIAGRGRSLLTIGFVAVLGLAVVTASAPSQQDNSKLSTALTDGGQELTDEQVSHRYWDSVSRFGVFQYKYESLAEIADDAHVIVRGRVVGVTERWIESFEDNELHSGLSVVFGIVAVDEVLKGTLHTRTTGTVLVSRLGFPGARDSDLPKEEVLIFLKNYSEMRLELGFESASDPEDIYYYARPNGYQCVLRNMGGITTLIHGPANWEIGPLGPFPSNLEGRPFGELLTDIREAVEAATAS